MASAPLFLGDGIPREDLAVMIAFPTGLRGIARLLPLCLLLTGSLTFQSARAQDAVFDAISGNLFENVLYAQAQ
ncbi:MAG: hypothetical protein JZU55_12905, partial [Afipia sp.]|nr:hypothetical protein [Afipia sp.]